VQPVLDGGYDFFGGRGDEHVEREAYVRQGGALEVLRGGGRQREFRVRDGGGT
jgi:hypothetical protein